MIDELVLNDDKTIRVFSDPLHQRMLFSLVEKGPATSADLARRLGVAAPKMHYHLARMEAAGLLELDREITIHGIQARYLRPAARSYRLGTTVNVSDTGAKNSMLTMARSALDHTYDLFQQRMNTKGETAVLRIESLKLSQDEANEVSLAYQNLLKPWVELSQKRRSEPMESVGAHDWHLLYAQVRADQGENS